MRSTRSDGEQPDTCGACQRPFRKFSRSRRVHVRDAESVLGRPRDSPSPPSRCRRFGSGRGTRDCHQSVHDVNHDGIPEERRQGCEVARTLARQFGKEVEAVCAPFQFALSTRAGTDCVGQIWVLTDADTECTILSIDGVGAYDHVFWSSFLTKLRQVPGLRGLLPFVGSTPNPQRMCGPMTLGRSTGSVTPRRTGRSVDATALQSRHPRFSVRRERTIETGR